MCYHILVESDRDFIGYVKSISLFSWSLEIEKQGIGHIYKDRDDAVSDSVMASKIDGRYKYTVKNC